jgi:hypothetical protein
MNRGRAYRRFMKQKAKRHVKAIVKNIWQMSEILENPKLIGKMANHRKIMFL